MKTPVFESYREKYQNVRMKREDGVLEVALHPRGGPLEFNGYVHEALVHAFRDIGDDRDNHVAILTGVTSRRCSTTFPWPRRSCSGSRARPPDGTATWSSSAARSPCAHARLVRAVHVLT